MSEDKGKKRTRNTKSSNDSFTLTLNKKVVTGVVGVIAAVAIGFTVIEVAVPTKLESAYASCKSELPLFEFYSTLDPDGKALYLDGAGEESKGLQIEELTCAIIEVGVPESVISRMNGTTALMGQQEATFNGITARWFYHPSNGLDISFEID